MNHRPFRYDLLTVISVVLYTVEVVKDCVEELLSIEEFEAAVVG